MSKSMNPDGSFPAGHRRPVLLVGEQPPERWFTDPTYREKHSPMFPYPPNCAGARMRAIADLGLGEYLYGLDRVNLFPEPVRKWDPREAISRAKELLRTYKPTHVFACGRRVACAFGFDADANLPCVLKSSVADARLIGIPHPSGRNPQYRDPKVTERVRDEFQKVQPLLADWEARRAGLRVPAASE